ncbi:hypothetical protein F5882DRAFT_504648 [Hyaloscypha sp. PMI_1271]|nr:hypothetical protein F5882DRAFT_504648 [Hyaloscypha sp. PMI_1271]
MAPPAKKQKVNDSKSPIVFQSLGLKPDVSMKVFDVEFHVHSALLKLHSAFFRKFLDSADKVTSASTNATANADSGNGSTSDTTPPEASATRESMVYGEMKYKWVTKVDEGEMDKWHLVADNPKNEPLDLEIFTGNKKTQAERFEKLLCGVYLRPYSIDSIPELTNLTDMADYYRMLPIVSHTLSNALLDSQEFIKQLKTDPCAVFEAAAKLRHKVLFREALVWVVADWRHPAFKEKGGLSNPGLRQVARCVYGEIATMVSRSTSKILDGFLTPGCTGWLKDFGEGVIHPQYGEHWNGDDVYLSDRLPLSLAKFFRNIVNHDVSLDDMSVDPLYLSDLLRNNLVLD